jgi:phosphohistidine phosphatase SixA
MHRVTAEGDDVGKSRRATGTTVLCLIRHGDAGERLALAERDALRPLTERGRKQARRAGKALRRLGLVPQDAWTSRLVRADETAKHAMKAAKSGVPLVSTAALSPAADPARILSALEESPPTPRDAAPAARPARAPAAPDPVVRWLVGHDPHLTRLLGLLVAAQPMGLPLSKGAVAVVEFAGPVAPGAGRLVDLLSPDAIRALSRRARD